MYQFNCYFIIISSNHNIYIFCINLFWGDAKMRKRGKLKYLSVIVTVMFLATLLTALPNTRGSAEWKSVEHYLYRMQHMVRYYKHIKVEADVYTCRNTNYQNLILVLHFGKRGSNWHVEWFTAKVSSQSGYIPDYPDDNPFSYYPRKHYASNLNNLFPFIHGVSDIGMGSFAPVYNHQWKNSNWKITKSQNYAQWTLACGWDYDYDKHDMGAAFTGGYVSGKTVTFTYSDHAAKAWWYGGGDSRAHFSWSWTLEW